MKTQIIFTKQEAVDALKSMHGIKGDEEVVIEPEQGVLGKQIPYSPQHAFGCMCSICNNLLAPKVTC